MGFENKELYRSEDDNKHYAARVVQNCLRHIQASTRIQMIGMLWDMNFPGLKKKVFLWYCQKQHLFDARFVNSIRKLLS